MKNTFPRKFTVYTLAGVLGATFIGCGDDDSYSPSAKGLPAEMGDKAELETHECNMDIIGEKVYVIELEENYECDGEKWFNSYDQTKPSSTSAKSSSSKKTDGSSDSKATDNDGSSIGDDATSSSSAMSSSSHPTEIIEPEITVNENCIEVDACDAMVKTDISTWHFVRKDNFGDNAEYTYTVDGKDLVVTIKSADGSTSSKTYSMYNMESEVGVEMAFNAAKATCKDGGENNNMTSKICVKDTVRALPECNASRKGFIGKKDSSSYVICKNGSWIKATETDMDTYGKKCSGAEVGSRTNGVVNDSNKYYCSSNGWVLMGDWSWDLPKEYYLNSEFEYGTMTDSRDKKVYRTTTIGNQVWMAENLNYSDSVATPSLLGKSWCYKNDPKKCDVAGRFYTWAAAIDSVKLATDADNPQDCGNGKTCTLPAKVQGICDKGWHLPSWSEWSALFTAVGEQINACQVLKSQTGWRGNGNGTDAFGFSALPAGSRYGESGFGNDGYIANFWSSTEYTGAIAYNIYLYYGEDRAFRDDAVKASAFSVRCVKDSE